MATFGTAHSRGAGINPARYKWRNTERSTDTHIDAEATPWREHSRERKPLTSAPVNRSNSEPGNPAYCERNRAALGS